MLWLGTTRVEETCSSPAESSQLMSEGRRLDQDTKYTDRQLHYKSFVHQVTSANASLFHHNAPTPKTDHHTHRHLHNVSMHEVQMTTKIIIY